MRAFEPDDIEQLTSLINVASVADDISMQMAPKEVVAMLDDPNVDRQDDVRATVRDREIVRYSMVIYWPSTERENQATVNGVVAAPHRNQGIGTELFEWGLSRATEKLRSAEEDLSTVCPGLCVRLAGGLALVLSQAPASSGAVLRRDASAA